MIKTHVFLNNKHYCISTVKLEHLLFYDTLNIDSGFETMIYEITDKPFPHDTEFLDIQYRCRTLNDAFSQHKKAYNYLFNHFFKEKI